MNYFEPLRALIEGGIKSGFIRAASRNLAVFVDGPADLAQHTQFDWGQATMKALEEWEGAPPGIFSWGTGKAAQEAGLRFT